MFKIIEKIYKLSEKRINFLHNIDNKWFYKWYKTYIEWIQDELEETKCEIKEKNSVYLEDELWDVFWDYLCLLNSLEQTWYIDKKKVFERCYKKFSGRLWTDWQWAQEPWETIKKRQKEENRCEHEKMYKN